MYIINSTLSLAFNLVMYGEKNENLSQCRRENWVQLYLHSASRDYNYERNMRIHHNAKENMVQLYQNENPSIFACSKISVHFLKINIIFQAYLNEKWLNLTSFIYQRFTSDWVRMSKPSFCLDINVDYVVVWIELG